MPQKRPWCVLAVCGFRGNKQTTERAQACRNVSYPACSKVTLCSCMWGKRHMARKLNEKALIKNKLFLNILVLMVKNMFKTNTAALWS